MILPLTTDTGFWESGLSEPGMKGCVFRIELRGDGFHARWISPVAIFPCEGMRDVESERALAEAFSKSD